MERERERESLGSSNSKLYYITQYFLIIIYIHAKSQDDLKSINILFFKCINFNFCV